MRISAALATVLLASAASAAELRGTTGSDAAAARAAYDPTDDATHDPTYDPAQTDEWISIAPDLSHDLLDWTEDPTGTSLKLLRARRSGTLESHRGLLHGRLQGVQMEERTNTAGKFPILSRFPNQHAKTERGSRFVVPRGQVAASYALPWVTLFGEAIYTDTLYHGDERWDVRRATVTVGDLDRAPVYAKYGNDFVDFGHMGAYNPFLQSMNWHYFKVHAEGVAALGYAGDVAGNHVEASATWIPGGRQTRVATSDEDDLNFALDASVRRELRPGIEAEIGGGYLHATIYDSAVPHHIAPQRAGQETTRNGALNLRGEISAETALGGLDLMAEYTRTIDDWPATDVPVSALTVQGRWRGNAFDRPLALSASYGLGHQGESGTEWEAMQQFALGAELTLHPTARLQAEYVYNTGFAPLIMIRRASDGDVAAHTLAVGASVGF